jgi:phenylacetate-CoA ligase
VIWNEKYETMERSDLEQVQVERLQQALTRAARNVAFYREAFEKAGVRIEGVDSVSGLARLPFTTKEDLRASYPYGFFAVPLRDIVRLHSTSGTTGTPVVVGYTRNDLKMWGECAARVLAAGGVTEHDVVQIAFSFGLFSGGFGMHAGAERIGASVVPTSNASLEKQVLIMRDFKSTAIVCGPGYALALADAATEAGLTPGRHSLRAGFFGSEPWSEGLRTQIEGKLGITALDNYGLTEVLGPGVSFECEGRCGLHVNEDHFVVEVIDPRTLSPVAPGTEGELVFTTISKEGFPVIRYRTGDLGVVDPAPCACGRTLARMSRIRGRIDDLIILGAVKLFPSQVEQILLEEQGVEPHFQIVVDRREGVDTLEIRVELSTAAPDIDDLRRLDRVKAGIARRCEVSFGIRPVVTLLDPRTFARGAEGKAKRVVDKRPR